MLTLRTRIAAKQAVCGLFREESKNMKTKQLANILIKLLGLSVAIHSIPGISVGLSNMEASNTIRTAPGFWAYPMSSLVMAVIGVCLMIQSRQVARLLFRSNDE
jgi:hypothetical protein